MCSLAFIIINLIRNILILLVSRLALPLRVLIIWLFVFVFIIVVRGVILNCINNLAPEDTAPQNWATNWILGVSCSSCGSNQFSNFWFHLGKEHAEQRG